MLRAVFFLFAFFSLSFSASAALKTDLDRDTIMVGETVGLNITVENGNPQSYEGFPNIPGISIQYRGMSQNLSIVNGVSSTRRVLNYAVTGTAPGEYNIPSIKVVVDGRPIPTEALRLRVTKSDITAQNRYAFLKLVVPKEELYVGEIMPIEIQLYVTQAENVQAPQLKSDGFIIHKQAEHSKSHTQVGNIIYNVISFKMSVSAAKAGHLTLGPAETSLDLLIRAQQDPNDLFGFFNRFQRRTVKLASTSIEMNVLPLPSTNMPPGFSGAIGSFTWNVSASPLAVAANDPITLKVAVSGRGNLDNLDLPEITWPDFKSYQPNSSISSDDPLGLQGVKTFEQVVIPQSASIDSIPPLALTYFDPEKKEYKTLSHPAIPIKVSPGTAGPAQPAIAAAKTSEPEQEQPRRTDIVHIKMSPGRMLAYAPPLIQQPWFLALQAIPLFSFIGFTVWRKKQDALANNPRLRRKREVRAHIASGTRELRELATSNQADAFYARFFRLLQEQLGERLNLPASAITEAVVEDLLPARGASAELIERLRRLFHICNQARYAPIRSHQELLALCGDLEHALNELQSLPD